MLGQGVHKAEIVRKAAAMCMGWPYVYAAAGEMCTPEWRKNRMGYSDEKYAKAIKDTCPVLNGTKQQAIGFAFVTDDSGNTAYQAPAVKPSSCAGCKWQDCLCFDCRGFTRKLLAWVGISLAGGGATSQYETKSNWVAQGTIDQMPRSLTCCVFKRKDGKMSHTGMHMMNGEIIHCSTVVKQDRLPGTPAWTHYAIPAGLYTNEELAAAGVKVTGTNNIQTLRKGSGGEAVSRLQKALNDNGASLKVDGIYGTKTESAVKAYQQANGLAADGVAGPRTLTALGLVDPGDTPLPASRAETIWNALLKATSNPFAAAGIMGNLEAESGLNPINLNGAGNSALGMTDDEYTEAVDSGTYTADQFINDGRAYGLAQWCYSTRKAMLLNYAIGKGTSIGNLETQLSFLIEEMQSYKDLWNTLINTTSVKEASDAVLLQYEKPANQGDSVRQKRAEYGTKYFDRYIQASISAVNIQDAINNLTSTELELVSPPDTVIIPADDFHALKAALSTALSILSKYEK